MKRLFLFISTFILFFVVAKKINTVKVGNDNQQTINQKKLMES